MKLVIILKLCITVAVFLFGCSSKEADIQQHYRPAVYKNVERIFMHSRNEYTILYYADSERIELLSKAFVIDLCLEAGNVKFVTDISQEHYNLVSLLEKQEDVTCWHCCGNALRVEMHIHSTADINGAGWSRGKFGSGQTNVIE